MKNPPNRISSEDARIGRLLCSERQWCGASEFNRRFLCVFCLSTVLILAGCRSAEARFNTASSAPDLRALPLGFSPDEIVTRTWTQESGQRVELLRQQIFNLRVPEPLEVMVATFGIAGSNRAVCIDFYAAQEMVRGGTNYCLLCHDQDPPAFNTKISYEKQNNRSFFTVEGQDQLPSSKRAWHMYYYSLNRKCQLQRHASNWFGPPIE